MYVERETQYPSIMNTATVLKTQEPALENPRYNEDKSLWLDGITVMFENAKK